MNIAPFKLERYFAKYEFSAPYLLCCSDCEALTMEELLAMADEPCLQLWKDLKLSYTESQGHPILRKEIASLYTGISDEKVLVLTPEEGIFIAMQCMLKAGDHVICTFPGYQSLYEIARSLGCTVDSWLPRQDEGWHFDTGDLKKLIRRDTRLIITNFPHNPTGALISREDFQTIAGLAGAQNIPLFSDEMYRFLEYSEQDRLPAACEVYENAVSLCGMSKSFALPGLRIGWLVAKNARWMQQFAAYKDYTTICNSAPAEILALIGLRAKSKFLGRNLGIIHANLKLLNEFFGRHAALFNWHAPKAGPVAFAGYKGKESIESFCERLVEQQGVLLLPGSAYDYEGNYFRIGIGRKNLPCALEKFEAFLKR